MTTTQSKYTLEFFPSEYIELQKEVMFEIETQPCHPKLAGILGQFAVEDIDMKLAHIAAYCEVILDGDYNLESRIRLCEILKEKLILRRELPKTIQIITDISKLQ